MTRARDLADLASSGVIEGTEVADDAITLAKMASGTDGNVISYDASGNPVAISTGNDGQVLTSAGAGQPPAFESISASPITALNNATANELVTVGATTTELDAETYLTWDGATLHAFNVTDGSGLVTVGEVTINSTNATGDGSSLAYNGYYLGSKWRLGEVGAVNSGGNYGGDLVFHTNSGDGSGASLTTTEKSRITREGKVGIGETAPLGHLHVKTADSGASVASGADEFVIEGSGTSGMTILSGTSGNGIINFGDSGSNEIGQVYYSHSSNNMVIATNGATAVNVDSAGIVTQPLQPSFMIQQTTSISVANTHTIFSSGTTEQWDTNADFATNGSFTAPVTGKYVLCMNILYKNISNDTLYEPFIKSSNREYSFGKRTRAYSGDGTYLYCGGTVVADMDANDTVYCAHYGGDPSDISEHANNWSYFQGYLLG